MPRSRLKKGLLTLSATGLLLAGASAAPGPYPEVQRDPFVKASGPTAPPVTRPRGQTPANTPPVTPPTRQAFPDQVSSPAPLVEVSAPQVVVSGIVASAGHRQAIIHTGSRSLIVSAGQQVADYRVKAIDANSVTFEAHGRSFKIPLGQPG